MINHSAALPAPPRAGHPTPARPAEPAPASPGPATASAGPAFWREMLEPYTRSDRGRSVRFLLSSVLPFIALFVLMDLSLSVSYLLTLALAVPTAGFLVRIFIIFHDCTHGSFLASKRANRWLGTSTGLLVFSTFECWKHNHAVHHATAGDLERRGVGDLPTLTVSEYRARPWRGRLAYRLFRNPLVMFGLGPFFALVVQPRIVPRTARPRIKRSVRATNVAVVALVAGLCGLMGWREYLLVEIPTIMLAGAAGIWLFYVQHQFEDAYWENSAGWSYVDAALRGSSYLKLPKVLQFFTGNIGFHHVHHLSARIPSYNLPRAHEENPILQDVPTLSLMDGMRSVKLKLYDEDLRRMVGFAQARRRHGSSTPLGATRIGRAASSRGPNSGERRSAPPPVFCRPSDLWAGLVPAGPALVLAARLDLLVGLGGLLGLDPLVGGAVRGVLGGAPRLGPGVGGVAGRRGRAARVAALGGTALPLLSAAGARLTRAARAA